MNGFREKLRTDARTHGRTRVNLQSQPPKSVGPKISLKTSLLLPNLIIIIYDSLCLDFSKIILWSDYGKEIFQSLARQFCQPRDAILSLLLRRMRVRVRERACKDWGTKLVPPNILFSISGKKEKISDFPAFPSRLL